MFLQLAKKYLKTIKPLTRKESQKISFEKVPRTICYYLLHKLLTAELTVTGNDKVVLHCTVGVFKKDSHQATIATTAGCIEN